jgi:hypothetical protein
MLLFRILQRMLDIAAGGDGVVKSSGNDGKKHPTRKLIMLLQRTRCMLWAMQSLEKAIVRVPVTLCRAFR